MRHSKVIRCACLAGLLMGVQAFADETGYSVGINFVSGLAASSLQQTDVAGLPAITQANWNNAVSDSSDMAGSLLEVQGDDFGASAVTFMTLSWTCNNTWTSTGGGEENNAFPAGADRTLMTGYLDTGGATTTTITLNSVPDELLNGYDLYLYLLGGTGNKGGGYRVLDSAGTPLTDYLLGDSMFGPTEFVRDLGWNHQDQGNYLVFRGLTAPDLIIEATTENGLGYAPAGGPRAPINAIQLVAAELDLTPPTVPANFVPDQVGEAFVDLKWDASTDASGTVWYEIERDDLLLATQLGTTFHDVNVVPQKTYVYRVRASDDSHNPSEFTEPLSVTTAGASAKGFSIAVNFTSEREGPNVLAPTDVAGVIKQANWNNSAPPGASGFIADLVADDNGDAFPTTATLTWSCPNTWTSTGGGEENNAFPDGADKVLMTGYVDTGDATTTTIQVSALPNELTAGYDVYVYMLGGVGNKGGGYRILDTDTGEVLRDNLLGDGPVDPTNFVRDLGWSHQDQGNYLVFRGLTAMNFTLEASTANGLGAGGGPRAPVNALQMVAAPLDLEPPSIPANLEATEVGETVVDLRWDASTDQSSTLWYEIVRDDILLARQFETTFQDVNVLPNKTYVYQIRASDDSFNLSEFAEPLSLTTAGAGGKGYSIAINFTSERQGPNVLASTDVAGLIKQANWNNSAPAGASGTLSGLVADDNGDVIATTATLSWSCPNTWTSTGGGQENNAFPAGPDRVLMTGYIDTGDATTTTIQVNDLPPELTIGYDVYVYMLGGAGDKGGGYRLVDTFTGEVLRDNLLGDGPVNPTGFVRDLGLDHQDNGTYLVFRGLTASSFTLEASTANGLAYAPAGAPRAPVNALQLVAATPDFTPPSVPANLEAALVGETFADLSWDPATDDSGTFWYELYRDGALLARQLGTTFRDTPLTGLTEYLYQVRAVDDSANPSELSDPLVVQTAGQVEAQAAVRNELYTGMSTTTVTVADLLANPSFPDSPNVVRYSTSPEGPVDYADGYGSRLSGWFTPATDGDYIFFLAADDNAELYLSTDDSPANKHLIAAESNWSGSREWIATSGGSDNTAKRSDQYAATQWPSGNTISLGAGVKYYFEVLQKEGAGGDNVAFTWCLVGNPLPNNGDAPIIGPELSAMIDPTGASVAITRQPVNVTATEGTSATVSLEATGASPYVAAPSYQWYRNGEPIRNANSAAYTTPELSLADDHGATFKCFVAVPGAFVFSDEITLTVVADEAPPRITQVTVNGLQAITVSFNEPVEQESAEMAAHYDIAPGVTVQAALWLPGGDKVRLTTSAVTPNAIYTLTAGGIVDRYGNTLPEGTTFAFISRVIGYTDIILADQPVAFYRFEETGGTVATNYGSKGGHGAYMVYNGGVNVTHQAKTGAGPQPPDFLGFGSDNRAALFDAFSITSGGDWIDAKSPFLNNLAAFSLEYWVYPVRTNTADGRILPNRAGIVGQNDAVEYGFINPGTIQIWTPGGGSLDTAYTFPDSQWHHVATIADGQSIRNYFDGKFINSTTRATANYGSSAYNVHIGGGGVFDTMGNFFNGLIDEVAIFDKAIPAERIAAHFQAGKVGGIAPSEQPSFTSITCVAGEVTIAWDILAILEEAPAINGPWSLSANQANPQTIPATGTKFYRLRN